MDEEDIIEVPNFFMPSSEPKRSYADTWACVSAFQATAPHLQTQFGELVKAEERRVSPRRGNAINLTVEVGDEDAFDRSLSPDCRPGSADRRPGSAGVFRTLANDEIDQLDRRSTQWFLHSRRTNEAFSQSDRGVSGFRLRTVEEVKTPPPVETKEDVKKTEGWEHLRRRRSSNKRASQMKNKGESDKAKSPDASSKDAAAAGNNDNPDGGQAKEASDDEFEVAVDIEKREEEVAPQHTARDKALQNMMAMQRGNTDTGALRENGAEYHQLRLLQSKIDLERLLHNPPKLVYPPKVFGDSEGGRSVLCARA